MKIFLLSIVLLLSGYLVGLTLGRKSMAKESFVSSQLAVLIPCHEYYRAEDSLQEAERIDHSYHLALANTFSMNPDKSFPILDEMNYSIVLGNILRLRELKGLPQIEAEKIPSELRENVISNFNAYLEHIKFKIEPVAGGDATR